VLIELFSLGVTAESLRRK